ncbi:MAG TPA: GntR family transcriptional regulator [Woeseiaceae bacterium]|nr:GntR family transcriptional regulator [Woeseiaceae bacterium]
MSVATDKAYRVLRDRIFRGEYAPGARLKERQLCADLEVSRTPVREALRRLESEGLVHIEPRRGGVVSHIDPEEAEEIFALGAVIESFAAGMAARKATDRQVAGLEKVIDAMRETLARADERCRTDYIELDGDLHERIIDMADSRRLSAALHQVVGVPLLAQAFNQYSFEQLQQSFSQHRMLVEALRARDADWAESAMRYHVLTGRNIMLDRIGAR